MTKDEIKQMLQIVGMDPRTIEMVEFAYDQGTQNQQPKCNPHPEAPHGFNRQASHQEDRYVCDCESWDAYQAGRQAGVEAMLDYDNPEPAPYNPLTTSEIVECAVKVWRFDANDVSENTIRFAREIERLTLER
jgi:hypothetical protein